MWILKQSWFDVFAFKRAMFSAYTDNLILFSCWIGIAAQHYNYFLLREKKLFHWLFFRINTKNIIHQPNAIRVEGRNSSDFGWDSLKVTFDCLETSRAPIAKKCGRVSILSESGRTQTCCDSIQKVLKNGRCVQKKTFQEIKNMADSTNQLYGAFWKYKLIALFEVIQKLIDSTSYPQWSSMNKNRL